MAKIVPPRKHTPKTNIRDIMGRFDELPMQYNAALDDYKRGNGKMMAGLVMCKIEGDKYVSQIGKSSSNARKGK
jgi:hypothetical protein